MISLGVLSGHRREIEKFPARIPSEILSEMHPEGPLKLPLGMPFKILLDVSSEIFTGILRGNRAGNLTEIRTRVLSVIHTADLFFLYYAGASCVTSPGVFFGNLC